MNTMPSVIHQPESSWAAQLRQRALEGPQTHNLGRLLDGFREHSGFYRDRIGRSGNWQQVPLLKKSDVSLVPVVQEQTTREVRTSGTTGTQLSIYSTRREREFRRALLYRPQLFYDLPDVVNQVVFMDGGWCADPGTVPKEFHYGGRHYRTWFAGAGAEPGEILKLLQWSKPELVRGISSGIVRFIEEAGVSLRGLGVRILGPGGEFLPGRWRSLMKDAFDAPVLDRYGSTETGPIAWQCPRCSRYHANTDEIILEAEPEGLVATPLFSQCQPLLRYQLGDSIELKNNPSDCEIGLPSLEIRAARRDDWILDGNGRKVSPLSFQFEQVPHLNAWRLHQAADGVLCLYFDAESSEMPEQMLSAQLEQAVPDRPYRIINGIWKLNRPGKFKRVSSDLGKLSDDEPQMDDSLAGNLSGTEMT